MAFGLAKVTIPSVLTSKEPSPTLGVPHGTGLSPGVGN